MCWISLSVLTPTLGGWYYYLQFQGEEIEVCTGNCLCVPPQLLKCYLPGKLELKAALSRPLAWGWWEFWEWGREHSLALEMEVRILSSLVLASWPWDNLGALVSLDFLRVQ